jgi:transcriptional regulator GlxA family with amidase domain
LSVSHFQHLFKKEAGTGVVKYTNNLRLNEARRLLETTHLHIKEIRSKVGIKNESHFQHDFKEKFGDSPGDYRKKFYK